MIRRVESISEIDFQAYVDDELPPSRRIEIETHICRHTAEAARLMADLRTRGELRLALADMPRTPRGATINAALRLERGLRRDRILQRVRRVAAVATLVGVGWLAHTQVGPLGVSQVVASAPPPAYVTDAVMAHRATLVRAGMRSQRGAPAYDPADIRSATAIIMPPLPQGWAVADTQIFPSTFGPSVEMAVRIDAFGVGSLFAVRPGTFEVTPVTMARKDDFTVAYWQVGEVAYALVAKADSRDLEKAATGLAESLY
jgi:anti-sigma factor RsiW